MKQWIIILYRFSYQINDADKVIEYLLKLQNRKYFRLLFQDDYIWSIVVLFDLANYDKTPLKF